MLCLEECIWTDWKNYRSSIQILQKDSPNRFHNHQNVFCIYGNHNILSECNKKIQFISRSWTNADHGIQPNSFCSRFTNSNQSSFYYPITKCNYSSLQNSRHQNGLHTGIRVSDYSSSRGNTSIVSSIVAWDNS